MKRLILYILFILFLFTLGFVGYVNRPMDYLNSDVLDKTFYRYNLNDNTYEEILFTKDKIKYTGKTIVLDKCSSYKFQSSTGIIKMDCGRAFRVVAQKKEYLVINVDNNNYFFFSTKESSYNKEFNSHFGMNEEDIKFEAEEKLKKAKINSELLDELIKSNEKSYIFVKDSECNQDCLLVSYYIDKITEDSIYYIESSDLNSEQLSLINQKAENTKNPKVFLVGKNSIKLVDVIINGFGTDLTGYLDSSEVIIHE